MRCYHKHSAASAPMPAAARMQKPWLPGEADINQCPPGGEVTIQALADLLGKDPKPLNAEHGEHSEKRGGHY